MLSAGSHRVDLPDFEIIRHGAETLADMLSVLQSLAIDNSTLHHMLAGNGHAYRQRLDMLFGIVGTLTTTPDGPRTPELHQRAIAITSELAGALEDLAEYAEHDFG